MKFTVDVDCTPEEARTFLGLPDVKPMQEEMMAIMRDKAMENLKMMEADKIMQMWGPMMNQGMANIHDFFSSIMTGAANGLKNPMGGKPGRKA